MHSRLLCLLAALPVLAAPPRAFVRATELVTNGSFEAGSSAWSGTTAAIGTFSGQPAHQGSKCAWLGGDGRSRTEYLYQKISIPSAAVSPLLSYYLHVDTAETTTSKAYDKLYVRIRSSSGTTKATLATYSNLDKANGYALKTFDLSAYKGQTIQVYFTETEDSSLQTSFVLDDISVSCGASDATAPTVSARESGTSGTLSFGATATDDVGVTKVEWYVDGTLAGSDASSPYAMAYPSTGLADGSHSLVAKAYDAAGNVGTSSAVAFTVQNGSAADTTAPIVTAIEAGNAGMLTFSATAADNVGVISVKWYVDGGLAGEDTSAPYSITYQSTLLTDGTHSLVAYAYDAAGNVGSSAAVSFTIANGSGATLPDPLESRIRADLEYLCSDTCAGRKTGTTGATTAATYIASKMQETGLSAIKTGGMGGSTVYHFPWTYSGSYATNALSLQPVWTWSLVPSGQTAAAAKTAYDLVGVIPGTDASLKDEYIVLTAHYDHLGTSSSGAIYRGADDNASGTAGLLEVARLLINSSPKRTIAFLSVSGEEQGLLGSAAFLNNPPISLASIKGNINLDMIGRNSIDELHVTPAKIDNYVSTLVQDARTIAFSHGMTLSAGIDGYWQQSDHYSFAKKSIPCIFFNTNDHADLHLTTDTADKIGYAKLLVTLKIVRDLALKAANDSSAPALLSKSVWSAWTWGTYTLTPNTLSPRKSLHKGDAGPADE